MAIDKGVTDHAVLFPTLTLDALDTPGGDGLYAVVSGDQRHLLAPKAATAKTFSRNGRAIFGMLRADRYERDLPTDVTVLPVSAAAFAQNRRVLPMPAVEDWPVVDGHSCDAALWVYANVPYVGAYPAPITGEVVVSDGIARLMPLPEVYYDMKAKFLAAYGIPLIANNKRSPLNTSILSYRDLPEAHFRKPVRAKSMSACVLGVRSLAAVKPILMSHPEKAYSRPAEHDQGADLALDIIAAQEMPELEDAQDPEVALLLLQQAEVDDLLILEQQDEEIEQLQAQLAQFENLVDPENADLDSQMQQMTAQLASLQATSQPDDDLTAQLRQLEFDNGYIPGPSDFLTTPDDFEQAMITIRQRLAALDDMNGEEWHLAHAGIVDDLADLQLRHEQICG